MSTAAEREAKWAQVMTWPYADRASLLARVALETDGDDAASVVLASVAACYASLALVEELGRFNAVAVETSDT